ncbi:MAG: CcmD family protein [Saprospiraceae bacterium]
MEKCLKTGITLLAMLLFSGLHAQSGGADFMRNMGKMYVVVGVIVTIFIGIVLFLVYIDRRLTKIENQINDHG